MNNPVWITLRSQFGNRAAVAIAGAVCFTIGAGGWAAAERGGNTTKESGPSTTSQAVNSIVSAVVSTIAASTSSVPANTASSSSVPTNPLPAPFTKSYTSAGGSITVTWSGTAFSLDAVSPAPGFQAEIDDQDWDRIRVEFDNGDSDWRIEIRLNDGAIREQITH